MYDMYPWDKSAESPPPPPVPSAPAEPATRAVQVALDRRDNGGSAPDQAASGPAAQAASGPARQ